MRIFYFALLLLGFSSCTVFLPTATKADQYNLRVSYHQGPCFGRCPVYTLNLYDNGLLVYEGGQFSSKPGTWEKILPRQQTALLIDSFARADFANYPRAFRTEIADLASVDVAYLDTEGNLYETSFKDYAPPELTALSKRMNQLAKSAGYSSVQATMPTLSDRLTGNTVEPVELIVQMEAGVSAEAWAIRFESQGITFKERISPTGNYYLLELNPTITPTDNMLDILRADESVVSAQESKVVGIR